MSVIDDYLQQVEPPQRAELERVRRIIQQVAPEAVETISYAMPAFKYRGKYLAAFAAFKDHLSLFPTAEPVAALQTRLGDFATSKGTIQFTIDKPLPEPLIRDLMAHRLRAIEQE
ncbi:MAG TPA: DUF1801 domain-containing protein [Candidatus Saccharimonadia bacterium]|nr:DUF1801 domain-containing protein [Candidatus Saccharimonadia bacterium]